MTAADTAPRPKKDITLGVRYWRTNGKINFCFSAGIGKVVLKSV
jgi:hypothetical protein